MALHSLGEMPQKILTDRLILRPPRLSDAHDVVVAAEESLPELSQWQLWAREAPTQEQIEAYIAGAHRAWEERRSYLFYLFNYAERFLGTCAIENIDWDLRGFEIGYWLRTSAVGKGLMSEAVTALERHLFAHWQARCVVIKCDALNTRSAALPERLGYHLDGILRNERLNVHCQPQNTMVWSKTPEDPT